MKNYLHATTEFSLGQSLLSVSDIVDIVKTKEIDKAFVCDTMNVSAMIPLAEKLGDKVAFGVRIALVHEAEQKRLPMFMPKVWPLSERAMQIVYKYLSMAYERPYYFEQPRLDFELFRNLCTEAGNELAVTTGDWFSLYNSPKAEHLIDFVEGQGCFVFSEFIPIKSAKFDKLTKLAANRQSILNFPCLYVEGEQDVFPIHYSINKNVEFNFLNPYDPTHYYHEAPKLVARVVEQAKRIKSRYGISIDAKGAIARTEAFANLPFYRWQKADARLPKLAEDPIATLKSLCIKGFKDKLYRPINGYQPPESLVKTVYVERLKYELDVLDKLGFASYFLMVHELTSWCQAQGITTGMGRGSAGGSLISFCLDITGVDPIRFGLMFERFINPSRIDLPDIDLDFMSTRREEILEHLYDRYGKENVAGIINYATLQSKSALRSTGRIMQLPDKDYECSKLIPATHGVTASLSEAHDKVVEIAHFAKTHPKAWNVATSLEKKLRNFSTHAAGVIVSDRPLINDAVLEVRGGSRVINWDKKICEKQGLVKLDVLGLTTLDIIAEAQRLIKERHDIYVKLEDIPLDDKPTLDRFSTGYTAGVFQFDGGSVKRMLKEMASNSEISFDDLIAANALNRPGPIEGGLVKNYIEGKNGIELIDPWHPSIAEAVADTFNVPVYQEQIGRICMEFAGYSATEADNVRKIMGKKLPEEMKKERGKFVAGAVATHGVDEAVANEIFDKVAHFSGYGFNKSHSAAYSLLSYICMYFKVNYPVEFYAASLSYVDDKKTRQIINEAKKFGIDVLPPSINHSTDMFYPKNDKVIVAPLDKVKYLSQSASQDIMAARRVGAFTSEEDFLARTTKRFVNSRVVNALKAVGALDEILGEEYEYDAAERSKAINEFLPSLPLGYVYITRKMAWNADAASKLRTLLEDAAEAKGEGFVKPVRGTAARFMVVFDNASNTEAKAGEFTAGKSFNTVRHAMYRADLSQSDGYWTGLVKRAKEKGEKLLDNATLEDGAALLRKEIDILRPPVILCLGSNAARAFIPGLKGGNDNVGMVLYDKELDANIIVGFSPGMIYFNPDMESVLEELFETVADML